VKKSKSQPESHRFFHETHWLFKVFKMTKTTSSLILENSQGTGTSSYLNLECLKKQNRRFFTIQRTIQHCYFHFFAPGCGELNYEAMDNLRRLGCLQIQSSDLPP
jgi:tRNA U34 5-methylaminomethyl-2-thiouridine-forming methyltransferase MnmC